MQDGQAPFLCNGPTRVGIRSRSVSAGGWGRASEQSASRRRPIQAAPPIAHP